MTRKTQGEYNMKIQFIITFFLIFLLNCESKEERTSKKEDKLLMDLITAGTISLAARDLLKVPCSETLTEAAKGTAITVPASGSYKICGKENLTGTSVKFSNPRKYRITAVSGNQVLESSGCRPRNFSLDVTFSSSYGTAIVSAVDSSASAEHTPDSGTEYKITSSGAVNPDKYSCSGTTPTSRISAEFSVFFEPL